MKTISLLITLCLYTSMFSQKTGEVQYDMYVKMISHHPYYASLKFDKNRAEYIYQNKDETIQQIDNDGTITTQLADTHYYLFFTDTQKDSLYNLSRESYIKERIPKINWVLKREKKKIGGILCHKATTNFRGRNYIAWYAPSIPSSFGPWKLGGLPGLILQAHDDKQLIIFNFKKILFPSKKKIKGLNPSFKTKELLIAEKERKEREKEMIKEFYAMEKKRGSKSKITPPIRMELNYNDILVRNKK